MLKQAVIYLLLISFINTAFLPGENIDDTPFNGVEEVEEEYNSLYELVEEGLIGVKDTTPEDEDDDNPDWLKKTSDFFYNYNSEISIILTDNIEQLFVPIIINPYTSFLQAFSPPPKLS
jgi:hypothetical protein